MADSITKHIREAENHAHASLGAINRAQVQAIRDEHHILAPILLDLVGEVAALRDKIARLRIACENTNPTP